MPIAPVADMGEPCRRDGPQGNRSRQAVADTIVVSTRAVKKPTRQAPPRACKVTKTRDYFGVILRPGKVGAAGAEREIEAIGGHRCDPDDPTLIELFVSWKPRQLSWEAEGAVQMLDEDAVFDYWSTIDGGRFSVLDEPDLWHVLRIEGHRINKRTGKMMLQIAWVGSPDRSWEPEDRVAVYAREHVENYWEGRGAKTCASR